jgi:hypothetical protein
MFAFYTFMGLNFYERISEIECREYGCDIQDLRSVLFRVGRCIAWRKNLDW